MRPSSRSGGGACGGAPALGRLVEQGDRPVHADGQDVVAGLESDVLLVELDEGAVAVDPGHDRLPGLRVAADLARQLEQLERELEVDLVGQRAGRQRAALGLRAAAALHVGAEPADLEPDLLGVAGSTPSSRSVAAASPPWPSPPIVNARV